MMVKVIINDVKTGKSYQKEFDLDLFSGKKIGDKVNGDLIGLKDYELEIRGGSDSAGFPLSRSFDSPVRKKILIDRKGTKVRKAVRGNQFGAYTAQINMKVSKYGSQDLVKSLGVEKKEEVKEEKVEVKPKPEVKPVEEKPKEQVPAEQKKEVKEEKPKEEKKPEEKPVEKKEEVKVEEKKE